MENDRTPSSLFKWQQRDLNPIPSSRERYIQATIESSLTANKLQFERLRLIGRNKEIAILKECLARLTLPLQENAHPHKRKRRELIFIRGFSGTGKSALALELKESIEKLHKGIFCTGKYDVNLRHQPMIGFTAACKELCEKILELKETEPQKFQFIRCRLVEELGNDRIQHLADVVVQINDIAYGEGENGVSRVAAPPHVEERGLRENGRVRGDQLSAAFRGFLNIVSSALTPVVLVLDDLQWADSSSVELLKALISDAECSGIMIIGCYRSNEVGDEHIVSRTIRDLKDEKTNDESHLTITEIELGDLAVENLTEMLCELLSKDASEVDQLAALCHGRTNGNIFFVKAFLSMLVEEGMLKFHLGTFQWDFSVSLIETETSATLNLVDIIHSRMTKLADDALRLLKLAACLGNRFDLDILRLVHAHTSNSTDDKDNDFDLLLNVLIGESCLEAVGMITILDPSQRRPSFILQNASTMTLRFVHDKIQEAVISLSPGAEFERLQHQVGLILYEHIPAPKLESMVFVVVALLNCGGEKSPETAALNLRAGLKAKGLAAFSSAVNFVENGIRNLPREEMWETHFDLAIKLYSLGAISEYGIGRHDKAIAYCSTIFQIDKASPLLKCPAYEVKLDILHNEGSISEGLELGLDCLKELGCEFPKRKRVRKSMAEQYMKETKSKYIPTIEQVRKMPTISDPVILETLKLLERVGSAAYVIGDNDLYVLIRCRFVRLIGAHGLTADAAAALASFGNVLMHRYGYFETAKQVAELSLAIQEMHPSGYNAARTLSSAHSYVLGWSQPLQSRLKYFLEAYEQGLRGGNVFSSCTSLLMYLICALTSGMKLSLLEEDFHTYIRQMHRLNNLGAELARPFGQVVENLRTQSTNSSPVALVGGFMDENAIMAAGNKPVMLWVSRVKCLACMYFANYGTGADLFLKNGGLDILQTNFPGSGFGFDYIAYGVCCYAVARRTKAAKYKRAAQAVRSEVASWVKRGNPNLVHVLNLLDGEHYALKGKVASAKNSYNQAVVNAARGGFLQNAAVASERFGDYLLEIKDSKEDAAYRFRESIKHYTEWGAKRKADMLGEKHKLLLDKC